jgi:hypothetical protein
VAAICNLWRCPNDREQRCAACPNGGPRNLRYTPQPHTDPDALIRRADALLRRWAELYGEHNPQWLPPAGIVNWQEDAGRYLALRSLPTPGLALAALTESAKQHRARGDDGHASICEAALREAAASAVPYGVVASSGETFSGKTPTP